ncbi:N-acetylmuramoyl-L-alanine amidase [Candidatus Methylacidiphilum infernorum]|uniref:N-acetylmuramoyl-L-alanine amidase n=1 Tax=Candidatus Methylacidiphilum infernorum TaxID=511746 RepID=UPI001F5C1AA9|nr:N-acetylmuramoyl-L-alanine amidase [Candidatus Methylacidiphilum infernorum]
MQRVLFLLIVFFFLKIFPVGLFAVEKLSPLAPPPDWTRLDQFQETITREEFIQLINTLYSPTGAFWRYTIINGNELTIYSDVEHNELLYRLRLAPDQESQLPLKANWVSCIKTKGNGSSDSKPLKGLVICLDPGHIGGKWAKMEERFFQIGSDPPVIEAELNMNVCRRAAHFLEEAGARVVWTKKNYEPVTDLRPADLRADALSLLFPFENQENLPYRFSDEIEKKISLTAERLFYRNAEIRARAEIVNRFNPDLTICVHFNADKWSDHPTREELVQKSKLVVFVNGNYSEEELVFDDQKWDLLYKLLSRTSVPEVEVSEAVAKEMELVWNFPPESYNNWSAAYKVGKSPYVFARNLLANRIYHCPVVFIEGPYMNAVDAYDRIIAGDYDGNKIINGKSFKSIFVEYAEIITQGIISWATSKEGIVVEK